MAIVKVPLPLSVPLTVRLELLDVPGCTEGLDPKGRLQLLPIVVVCEELVLVITTRLKVALLQDMAWLEPFPFSVTVPPLALNVALPLTVKSPLKAKMPEVLVNEPPVIFSVTIL